MTVDELKELSNRLLYKGKPCFSVSSYDWRNSTSRPIPAPDGYLYLSTWINAVDVDDDKPTRIEMGYLVAIREIETSTESDYISTIKDSLIALESHEVHETISLDGVRIFDPHNLNIQRTKTTELKIA